MAPLLHCNIACATLDTPGHHYLGALQYKPSIGYKGMATTTKVVAGTVIDLPTGTEELAKIRGEFEMKMEGFVFDPIIPKG